MNYLINTIIPTILLLSIAATAQSQQRYFDYSGKDGCSPANIGHRLGGDLDEFSHNSIEGMNNIAPKQDSHCFKNWEFDLSEWQGKLYLSHDAIKNTEQTQSLVSLQEFESAFSSIKVTKPIVIDLKAITSKTALEKAVTFARNVRSNQESDIWFLVSPENTPVLTNICPLVSGEFDVMLYRRGGEYCGRT
jgi:hypothetical protein